MTALANRHDAVNLSQGFPDFPPSKELTDCLEEVNREGLYHQYAPMAGLLSLRTWICDHAARRDAALYDPETEATITCGATQAIFSAIQAAVMPGDEVILFSPAYDSYAPAVLMAGGKPRFFSLTFPYYRIDWDIVAQEIGPGTRGIVLNSPNNPSGAVLNAGDLDQLTALATRHNLWIVSDEVYDHILFDGVSHLSIASRPELRERAFVISSFGKTLHITGWKIGYCLAPKAMTSEFRKVHQFVTFAIATPFQHAIHRFLTRHQGALQEVGQWYQGQRDLFLQLTAALPLRPLPCPGTYFQLMDISSCWQGSDQAFCQFLIEKIGVAAIPVSAFYEDETDNQVVRFCFAKTSATLTMAADRLQRLADYQ